MPLLWDDELPPRKSKPKPNVLESHPDFIMLQSAILNGKIAPHRTVGFLLTDEDARKFGVKAPWRVATDRLRTTIREAGLEADYSVRKDRTNIPGTWRVTVTHEPRGNSVALAVPPAND